ncbi:unnamed protein product [Dibothriocephalus latus]|uniref:ABC transmembrane type-1 domain-containing protein n=1 Tax=Dibothriocephalus latus TaxID=60516 RepID=A0A3P6TRD1_DIBLA|nr:unnamed protein product [Dibothriocephalus latus]
MTPIQVLVVLWLMYEEGGYVCVFGILALFLFIPIQVSCGKLAARIKEKLARLTDERVRLFNELISGINILKLFNWEDTFSKFVQNARRRECNSILRLRFVQAVQSAQMMFLTKLAMLFLLIGLIFSYPDDPKLMISEHIITLYKFLMPLQYSLAFNMPLGVQIMFENVVSFKRIQSFLSTPLLEGETLPEVVDSKKPNICLNDVNANWNEDTSESPTLDYVSLSIEGPKLVAIVGPVGSEKSSLLQAILAELPLSSGSASRSANVAYMPQTAWIFAGTVREKILCGQHFDPVRYEKVLRISTLDVDLRSFPEGDAIEVGEKGVALSGGQKLRISLARLAYTSAILVFLDDRLAIVDPRVADEIFNNCICGYMYNRLRIMVTNQHHLLPKMDLLVVMQEVSWPFIFFGINFSELTKRPEEHDQKASEIAQFKAVEAGTSTIVIESTYDEVSAVAATEEQETSDIGPDLVLNDAELDVRSEAVRTQVTQRQERNSSAQNPDSADDAVTTKVFFIFL